MGNSRRLGLVWPNLYALTLLLIASFGLGGCAGISNSAKQPQGSVPAIASFGANPTTINSGTSTTLSWAASGATKITITPGSFTSTLASGSTSVSPTATTIYTLTATNSYGSSTMTVTVTVNAAGSKPTINTFSASPSSINSGSSSSLNWSTSGATTIALTPGSFTSTLASGSTSVSPAATTTYTLTASNSYGSSTMTVTVTVNAAGSKPTINTFSASPSSINSGSSSSLNWSTSGATTIAITPGSFTSTLASGSTSVSPPSTTTYTLTATNSAGSTNSVATVTVTPGSSGGPLAITTTSCPAGTQGSAYVGCTISVTGGTPPYTFAYSADTTFPPPPEGMSLNIQTGEISSSLIGGQGTYGPQFIVTDSANNVATQEITFSISGNNAFLANIFPATSIFHHRVDAASTGLPVDNSPAAPIYSSYLSATVRPFFGNDGPFPNGIPAIQVPANQPDVSVSTTVYQSYFTSGPIPPFAPVEGTSNSTGDRHVLVYVEPGGSSKPALYEMWQGIYENGPWTDSSNALWPDVSGNALTPQGNGTSDAAGLPVAPLLANADEVIGTGTPTSPNGTVQHPIRFTLNHMLNYWVWPATETAGVGSCSSGGNTIPTMSLISQSSPPTSCTMTGPAGEIYRLKASVATPACAATSPQAAILVTGFRNYGIILADNGMSGGLIGTPDARWNDSDLACITSLTLADFEPVNVSSLMVSTDSGATSQ
jgi:PKD repeat protein